VETLETSFTRSGLMDSVGVRRNQWGFAVCRVAGKSLVRAAKMRRREIDGRFGMMAPGGIHKRNRAAKWSGAAACMVIAGITGACSPFQSESFWGPSQKLAQPGASFAWKSGGKCEPDKGMSEHPEIDRSLHEAIDSQLTSLGYTKTADAKASLSACFRIGRQVKQAETGSDSWDEVIIEMDLADPKSGALVWRGRIRGMIDYSASPAARKSRLTKAVQQLTEPLRMSNK